MMYSFSSLLLIAGLLLSASALAAGPSVTDERLKLELFAAEPKIVTPTGIGVDAQGRVLAIESHTHFRPDDYDGPPADRIRRFEDTDGDGRADRITTFFEGTTATMSVALHPDGSVYVATRNDVFRLRDTNDDGVADERTPIARLESDDNYPHSGIAGFAFDPSGDVYFGLGENHAMLFKLTGSDGGVLTGIEGGHVYRCKPDGSKLQRVSVGCWNPHALAMDDAGRLFAVDNDPDSTPPCRLLHVVPGADYGYKYRNGRKGTHPFTAWNGELPGTLPMVCGTGEAPSGILVCGRGDKLPADYRGDLLVTSWGDHRIERYQLKPRGASVTAERIDVVIGDENFRPVGIVAGSDGAVYFTDWVDKSYTLHKKGRIWRLSAVKHGDTNSAHTVKQPDSKVAKTAEELRADSLRLTCTDAEELWQACDEADPFVQQAAREGLKRVGAVSPSINLKPLSAPQRLAALCILRDIGSEATQSRLPDFLGDPDPGIRLAALKWIGEERIESQRHALENVLTAGPTTGRLFSTYLAAIEKLDRPPRKDSDEWTNEQYVAEALLNESLPLEIRCWALRTLRPDHPAISAERLRQWLHSDDEPLRLEAVRTLRESPIAGRQELLWNLAGNTTLPPRLRCEAIVGIQPTSAADVMRLIELASADDESLAAEALRSLRGAELTDKQREELERLKQESPLLVPLIDYVMDSDVNFVAPDKNDLAGWMRYLEGPADPAAGERVFFHPKSGACSRCHEVDGRGGKIGPDLTATARTLDRRRLVESIVHPSKEIAPQFVVWSIQTVDGRARTGMLLGESVNGDQRYADADGKTFSIKPTEMEARRPLTVSLMPDGLPKQMTLQEFRDLLAFLTKETGERP